MTEQLQKAGFKEAGEDFYVLPIEEGALCLQHKGNNYVRLTKRIAYVSGLGVDEILFEGIIDQDRILNVVDPEKYPLPEKEKTGFWREDRHGVETFSMTELKPEPQNFIIRNADHAFTKGNYRG